jgi:pilus assembly protein CpaF
VIGREGDTITLQDVFLFEETGMDGSGKVAGKLSPTGIRPNAMAKIYSKKVAIAPALAALYPDRKAPDYTLGVRR